MKPAIPLREPEEMLSMVDELWRLHVVDPIRISFNKGMEIPLRAPEVHHFACLVAVQGQETNGLRVRGPRERRHNIFSALMKFVGRILAALDVDHVQGCNRVWITGLRKALLQKCRMNLKKVDEWISWHRAVIKPKIGNLRTVGRPLISPFRLSVCQFLAVDPILHAVENCGAAVPAELADVAALQIYNVQIIVRDKSNLVFSRLEGIFSFRLCPMREAAHFADVHIKKPKVTTALQQ